MALAAKLLGLAVLGYIAYGAVMVGLHTRYIYPFDQTAFAHPDFERVELDVMGAPPLSVYVARRDPNAPVVVYFMGNGGALHLFQSILDYHLAEGANVVAMAYRGGGGMAGPISERRLKADALAVIDALPNLGFDAPPLVHGYSLGSGIAVHVAARRRVRAVVLSSPYDRLCTLLAQASYLPACLLPFVEKWRSADDLDGIAAPVTILHGDGDRLIPATRSEGLRQAMVRQGIDVERRVITGAGHVDLMAFPAYLNALTAFHQRYK
ncbi:MAG: alpha/beta fold hydrolase [Pseudomonadota bacterium]